MRHKAVTIQETAGVESLNHAEGRRAVPAQLGKTGWARHAGELGMFSI